MTRPEPSPGVESRFLTLIDVATILNTSPAQAYALVRSGDLPAIKLGGRGQWRIEKVKLDEFIARLYQQSREQLEAEPDQLDHVV